MSDRKFKVTLPKARPSEFTIIGLDTPHGEDHPLYDARIKIELDPDVTAGFRRSVKHGLKIDPVRVKVVDGVLQVTNGRQRIRHLRVIEEEQIKAGMSEKELVEIFFMVETGDDKELFAQSRSLNVHVDSDIATRAWEFKRLSGYKTPDEIAELCGVSIATVKNGLGYLTLTEEVKEAVAAGEITSTAVLPLIGLPKEDQAQLLAEAKEEAKQGEKPTAERMKRKVAEKKGTTVNTPKDKIERATKVLYVLSGLAKKEMTKERLLEDIDKLVKIITGVQAKKDKASGEMKSALEALGDIGD